MVRGRAARTGQRSGLAGETPIAAGGANFLVGHIEIAVSAGTGVARESAECGIETRSALGRGGGTCQATVVAGPADLGGECVVVSSGGAVAEVSGGIESALGVAVAVCTCAPITTCQTVVGALYARLV